jgi:hypothetical protein
VSSISYMVLTPVLTHTQASGYVVITLMPSEPCASSGLCVSILDIFIINNHRKSDRGYSAGAVIKEDVSLTSFPVSKMAGQRVSLGP